MRNDLRVNLKLKLNPFVIMKTFCSCVHLYFCYLSVHENTNRAKKRTVLINFVHITEEIGTLRNIEGRSDQNLKK